MSRLLVFSVACVLSACSGSSPDAATPKDDDGAPSGPTTPKYLYQSDDKLVPSQFGTRENVTDYCSETYADNNAVWNLDCDSFATFLGYASDNGVRDLPVKYGVPVGGPVLTVDGTHTFASDFDDLISGRILDGAGNGLTQEGFKTSASVWTGFSNTGEAGTGITCGDWTNFTSGAGLARGTQIMYSSPSPSRIRFNWAQIGSSCAFVNDSGSERAILCLCWKGAEN